MRYLPLAPATPTGVSLATANSSVFRSQPQLSLSQEENPTNTERNQLLELMVVPDQTLLHEYDVDARSLWWYQRTAADLVCDLVVHPLIEIR